MNKEQKITSVSTNDNPPSRVQFTTTTSRTQKEDKNEYVNRLKYIGKLKREWYMRGIKEERARFQKLLEGHRLRIVEHTYVLRLGDVFISSDEIDDILAESKKL